jgi:hypothetical protein
MHFCFPSFLPQNMRYSKLFQCTISHTETCNMQLYTAVLIKVHIQGAQTILQLAGYKFVLPHLSTAGLETLVKHSVQKSSTVLSISYSYKTSLYNILHVGNAIKSFVGSILTLQCHVEQFSHFKRLHKEPEQQILRAQKILMLFIMCHCMILPCVTS